MKQRRTLVLGSFLAIVLAPAACALQPSDDGRTGSGTAALAPTGTDPPDPTTPPPSPPPPPSFESLMAKYAAFDINGDGFRELNSLTYALPDNTPPATAPKGMAIVFVDPRYLIDDPKLSVSAFSIKLWLSLYRADLMADGYDPRFVAADVERSYVRHQDGRDLLALRRFAKDVRASYPLRQVVFVGDFPEATILRRTLVRGAYTGLLNNGITYLDVDAMWVNSELVAGRTELPFADLDGNWEALYQENLGVTDVVMVPPTGTPSWPAAGGIYVSKAYKATPRSYQDVFYVRDDDTGFWENGGDGRLTVARVSDKNPELAANDLALANPIARPELQVSRINPRHVAVQPFTKVGVGAYESALDPDGFPNSVPAYANTDVTWLEDADFERRLVVDFMQRAHAFRSGSDRALPFRAAGIRSSGGAGLDSPSSISSTLGAAATFGSALNSDWAMLDGYVAWLKQPGVLRGVSTHSNAVNSWFGGPVSSAALEAAVGSRAFTWVRKEGTIPMLIPTYDQYDGTGTFVGTVVANMRLHRALWTGHALANAGQRFYVPLGCEVNSPANFATKAYWDRDYAPEQNAESTLFFVNGLGVLSRSKVFNDMPPASAFAAIKSAGNFGAALGGYFGADATTSSLNSATWTSWPDHRERTLQRKRAYNWGVVGDGTLRLKY